MICHKIYNGEPDVILIDDNSGTNRDTTMRLTALESSRGVVSDTSKDEVLTPTRSQDIADRGNGWIGGIKVKRVSRYFHRRSREIGE